MNIFKSNAIRYGAKSAMLMGASALIAMSTPAFSQVTTSGITGVITNESGVAVPNAVVTVRNKQSGFVRTITANAGGRFTLRNLSVSGLYDISVAGNGYQGERVEGVALTLGNVKSFNFDLSSDRATDEIIVVGQRQVLADVAVGPSASFSLKDLEAAPSINRDITDVLRLDPRIYVDESRGNFNTVQCAGKNSRFNSFTVDGVKMNDSFGLNENGYPTERMPFSFDAIEQVSVELAPFDVEYGGFTACNINAVTKSGGNEFHGGVFIDYTNDGLRGNSLEGQTINAGEFSETRYGIHVGGPIVKDKLSFFASYEKLNGANLFDRGVKGSNAVNPINLTQAELDEIVDISRTLYQYDPGEVPSSFDNDDEKILVKLDWNINNFHRASFTYNHNDGFNTVQSDGDLNEFELSNHLYERGSKLDAFVGAVYSDWNEKFSTEIRAGYLKLDGRQETVGGNDFGEMRIEVGNVDVYIGGDDSRQSNDLDYDLFNMALKGAYLHGAHTFSFGLEMEKLEVFNLFVQHTETEIRFRSIDDFRAGLASAIYYNNAPSGDPNDAAAEWGYTTNTVYAQDDYDFGNGLSVVAGLRYDWYSTDDAPLENTDFTADYGFSNSTNLDGEGLIQPRFGFQWEVSEPLTIRGGVGRYSGGNPNVWLSNNFSANNVLQFGQRGRNFGLARGALSLFDPSINYVALEDGVPAGPGYGIPEELYDAVAAGNGANFEINYLDPNFKIPSEWKFALGATYLADFASTGFFGGEYTFTVDLLFSKGENTAIVKHGDLEQIGTRTDGTPIYDSVREASFVLTNSEVGNEAFNASIGIAKQHDFGLDWRLGYSYSDAKDVSPMTSSVAFSNYQNRAFIDPEEEVLSNSNYNTRHRFTASAVYRKDFWDDNTTTLSLFSQFSEGAPYSFTQDGQDVYSNFAPYLDNRNNVLSQDANGNFTKRNGQYGSWWGKVDLKIEQQVPGFRENDKASVFMVIDNFTNLLNDEWGVLRQVNFPGTVLADSTGLAPAPDTDIESRRGGASRYEIRFGARYDF